MEVLQFKRLRTERYFTSLKWKNVSSLPPLLNSLENMSQLESTERQHSAISVLYIQRGGHALTQNQSPKPSLRSKTWAIAYNTNSLPTTVPEQGQWNQVLWVTVLFCKETTGSYLRFIQADGNLSMSLSGHLIREHTHCPNNVLTKQKALLATSAIKSISSISTEPKSSKLIWIVNQWPPELHKSL